MAGRIRRLNLPNGEYSKYLSEFQEVGVIASGGFGSVIKCINRLDEQEYAVKKIMVGRSGMSLDRVLREARILASMSHPNIVRYYHTWVESDISGQNELQFRSKSESRQSRMSLDRVVREARILANMSPPNIVRYHHTLVNELQFRSKSESRQCVYILMECLHKSLKNVFEIKADMMADKGNVLRVFKECLSGVSYIHSKNYLHGDLSAANIFLDSDMTAKVGDFGLSRRLDDDGCAVLSNSFGHEIYRAPECGNKTPGVGQRSEPVRVGTKADMFSLGVILARMVHYKEGLKVFKGLRDTGIPDEWKNGPYGPVLARLLALNPKDRPSAADLLMEMETLEGSRSASTSAR